MCGRFVLLTDLSVIAESFGVDEIACEYRPGNDISPGRQVVAVVRDSGNRLVDFRWGLIPAWAKDPSIGGRTFNARAETVSEKPSFKSAFRKRRCLIVADGFYEWQRLGRRKRQMYFRLRSGRPFGFAGLYETWASPDGKTVRTCAIVTTTPNALVQPIHDRMPVIVPKELEAAWISPDNQDRRFLLSMLKPYPSEEMEMEEVKTGFR